MTIEEVEDLFKGQYSDVEVYKNYNSTKYGFHTDRIKSVDDFSGNDEVKEYSLVDEEEYGGTILANSSLSADFEEWFGDKNAKVLLIKVAA
jgi:hypothetical protein